MYSKISANRKRKQRPNFEDEPPDGKLVSDADLFIKQLAVKQVNTNVNLEQQLNTKKEFCKSSDYVSLAKYTAGTSSLNDFNEIGKHCDEIDKLKLLGLNSDQVQLYLDGKKGEDYLKSKHRNINSDVLHQQLSDIESVINSSFKKEEIQPENVNNFRLQTEMLFSEKPTSVETKLLKFALKNDGKFNAPQLPHPMDDLKETEKTLNESLYSKVDIKKIRKKARQIQNQIDQEVRVQIKEPAIKLQNSQKFLGTNSKWDLKETEVTKPKIVEKKIYDCKPQTFYTIREGKIVKLNETKAINPKKQQISVEEIKQLPRFENYTPGEASKRLYIKNLASGVTEDDIKELFSSPQIVLIKIMKGKMRGQAFIEFSDVQSAELALNIHNGTYLKHKPIIIQFGKQSNCH